MLDCNKDQWGIFQACHFGVFLCVRHAWPAIRQKSAQSVARHDNNPDIQTSVPERSHKMNHIHHK